MSKQSISDKRAHSYPQQYHNRTTHNDHNMTDWSGLRLNAEGETRQKQEEVFPVIYQLLSDMQKKNLNDSVT